MRKYAIVLAAGKGTRMKTNLPKCAFPVLKKPMISYIVDNVTKAKIDETIVIVGYKKAIIEEIYKGKTVYQEKQLGTADAVKMAVPLLEEGICIILPGDAPLLDDKIIKKMIDEHIKLNNEITVGAMNREDPFGYGRIIVNSNSIERIVEEKDATEMERKIKLVNTGLIVVNNKLLKDVIMKVKNDNIKKEYYLTDIVELAKGNKIGYCVLNGNQKLVGINTLEMLNKVEEYIIAKKIKEFMNNGVCIVNSNTQTIGIDVIIEPGVIIYPGCVITGKTVIKKNAIIGPNTEIHNSIIEEAAICKHSVIYDSSVGKNTLVGPFAHLRMNCVIGDDNRIGNFVEIKKSKTGKNTNAAHLAYIGDTESGERVNFGCGSITVNYDGSKKHKTKIGNDVFIGCNANLLAPVIIGDNAYIAAGSTINKHVPDNSLAIARSRQENKHDYSKKIKNKCAK